MNISINDFLKKIESAIFYLDSREAFRLFRVWKSLAPQDVQQISVYYPAQKLQTLITRLKIVAFPQLPDEDSADLIRNNLLDFFDAEAPLEPQISEKLFFYPYNVRNVVREGLKKAILSNNQKLGELTVSQWLYEFDKKYDVKNRTSSAVIDFINSHPSAMRMDAVSRERLKKIIHAYDYLLVYTLPATEPELSEIIEAGVPEAEGAAFQLTDQRLFASPQIQTDDANTLPTRFNDALKTYPDLGEQVITSLRLNLKSFPEPVRPSIKNWISDYTFNVGFGVHDNMVRGNYLFQNPNAKNLSSEERERVGYVLKSYDENATVKINTTTRQLVFPAESRQPMPGSSFPRPIGPTSSQENQAPGRESVPVYKPAPSFPSADTSHPAFHNHISNQMTIRGTGFPATQNNAAPQQWKPSPAPREVQQDYPIPQRQEKAPDLREQRVPQRETISQPEKIYKSPAQPSSTNPIKLMPTPEISYRQPSHFDENLARGNEISASRPPQADVPIERQNTLYSLNQSAKTEPMEARQHFPEASRQKYLPDNKVSFSSPQKLPYEKTYQSQPAPAPVQPPSIQPLVQSAPATSPIKPIQPTPIAAPPVKPTPPAPPAPETHPYRISSSVFHEDGQTQKQPLPKNVVDLRKQ